MTPFMETCIINYRVRKANETIRFFLTLSISTQIKRVLTKETIQDSKYMGGNMHDNITDL